MAFLASGGTSVSVHLQCGGHSCLATVHASHLQRTTREHFDPNVLESTEVSAVPAEVVDAKTGVEEPLVVHGLNLPASGPQNNVHLLPKELDEKVTKVHFSALGAEPIVMSGEIGPTGWSPEADFGASCERFFGVSKTGAF